VFIYGLGEVRYKINTRIGLVSLWDLPTTFRVASYISVAKQRSSKQRALISDVDNMHGTVSSHKQVFERTSNPFAETNKSDSVPLGKHI